MCDALLELMKDELEESKVKGINLGISQGRQEQLQILITKKAAKGKTIEQIADELEETVETIMPLYERVLKEQSKESNHN